MNTNQMIEDLKKRFPLNNPASWRKVSTKQLKSWWNEYIKPTKEKKMKLNEHVTNSYSASLMNQISDGIDTAREIEKANDYAGKLIIEQIRTGMEIDEITQQDINNARKLASMVYPILIPKEE